MLDLQTTNKDSLPLIANKENCPFAPKPQNKISTQLNQVPSTTKEGMWTYEALELTMDVVENGTYSLRRASRAWNIPMSYILDHLNGKTRSRKMGPKGVLTEEKDVVVIAWTLAMGECGSSISLR
jgi:hypothetical protein